MNTQPEHGEVAHFESRATRPAVNHTVGDLSMIALFVLVTAAGCDSPAPSTDGLTNQERRRIDRIVGDARVVSYGEPAHGMQEAHDFALALFKYLVEQHDVRVLFLESSWHLNDRITSFIEGDEESVGQEDRFYLNAFATPQVTELLKYVREHNRRAPEDPVHVAGMQPENPVSDTRLVLAALDSSSLAAPTVREAAEALRTVFGDFGDDLAFIAQSMTADPHDPLGGGRRELALEALETLEPLFDQMEPSNATRSTRRARLGVSSLRAYLTHLVPFARALRAQEPNPDMVGIRRRGYQGGDEARSRIVRELLNTEYAGLRAMTWLHNWHAARRSERMGSTHPAVPPVGTISFGTWMDRALGTEQVVIGSVAVPVDTLRVPGSIAVTFHSVLGDQRSILNLHDMPDSLRDLPIDSAGTLVAEPTLGIVLDGTVLTDHFDGVAYFPTWTPVRR